MNTVNPDNFNETCKGYLKRAIKIMHENDDKYQDNLTEEMERRLFAALAWAFSEITMKQARKESKS